MTPSFNIRCSYWKVGQFILHSCTCAPDVNNCHKLECRYFGIRDRDAVDCSGVRYPAPIDADLLKVYGNALRCCRLAGEGCGRAPRVMLSVEGENGGKEMKTVVAVQEMVRLAKALILCDVVRI